MRDHPKPDAQHRQLPLAWAGYVGQTMRLNSERGARRRTARRPARASGCGARRPPGRAARTARSGCRRGRTSAGQHSPPAASPPRGPDGRRRNRPASRRPRPSRSTAGTRRLARRPGSSSSRTRRPRARMAPTSSHASRGPARGRASGRGRETSGTTGGAGARMAWPSSSGRWAGVATAIVPNGPALVYRLPITRSDTGSRENYSHVSRMKKSRRSRPNVRQGSAINSRITGPARIGLHDSHL
jgi:hypothetical protein